MRAGALGIGLSVLGATPALAAGLPAGGGSTLVAPLVNQVWLPGFTGGTSDQFAAIGSGKGISGLEANTLGWAGSDLPLYGSTGAYNSILSGTGATAVAQIPWALTGTGVGYNLGVKGLKLNAKVLAQIYEGRITKWNSKAIQSLNTKRVRVKKHGKKVWKTEKSPKLPNLKITPVFRSDGSGDTYAFTVFLAKGTKSWTAGQTNTFPSSLGPNNIGASGNAGVDSEINSVRGAVGYVAASYLISQNTRVAAIENAAGKFEYPDLKNIQAAASSATKIPAQGPNYGVPIMYAPKKYKAAYPISTFTYALIPHGGNAEGNAQAIKPFIQWVLKQGQGLGENMDFAPLPSKVLNNDRSVANSL
jgi:phosphate transport system substrate-binding protein